MREELQGHVSAAERSTMRSGVGQKYQQVEPEVPTAFSSLSCQREHQSATDGGEPRRHQAVTSNHACVASTWEAYQSRAAARAAMQRCCWQTVRSVSPPGDAQSVSAVCEDGVQHASEGCLVVVLKQGA
jgi:hypothetical protein